MSIKNKLAAVACGLALVGTVAAPVAALAVEGTNTGTTDVTIRSLKVKDSEGHDTDADQLTFTVPTKIPFYADATGKLTTANNDLKIVNGSVFPIHVTKMNVGNLNGWNLVEDVKKDSGDNAIQFTVNDAKAAAEVDLSKDASWNMDYAGSGHETVSLTAEGYVARVSHDLKNESKVGTITWTLAAGTATTQD